MLHLNWRRICVALAAVLVVVLAATVVTASIVIHRPLAPTSGTVRLPGLDGEVEILRDARGAPTIVADTSDDLFFAEGYVHAQDRFFEMDLRRHATSGRLAELVGDVPEAIEADAMVRTLGWRQVAENEWALLDPTIRSYLQAYADGVNAYIDGSAPADLGVEYPILGLTVPLGEIEPWTPVDSLAWLKAMAWDLRGNDDLEILRASAYATTGDLGLVSALSPAYPEEQNPPIIAAAAAAEPGTEGQGSEGEEGSDADASPFEPDSADALASALASLDAVPSLLGEGDGLGSNSWVVAGEHTASGSPMLANDPHLGISTPSVWYQVGLRCRQVSEACPFDVSGFSFSGVPGVVIGRNGDLAWGLTTMNVDDTDLFVERVFDDGTYLVDDERLALTERTETIAVAGGEDVTVTVRSTGHGPIISGVLPQYTAVASSPLGQPLPRRDSQLEVALAWTALEPGTSMAALLAMSTASDAADVAAAAALFDAPGQSIVFATTEGSIGFQASGRVPLRPVVLGSVSSDGSWPRPGWDSRYDWGGWLDPEELPAALDPDEGFIVAANQAVTAHRAGAFLGADTDFGYRAARIRELLEAEIGAGRGLTLESMTAIQLDATDPAAALLLPRMLEATPESAFVQPAVELLEEWDGTAAADSAAAVYFATVWANLLQRTFGDQLPPAVRPDGGSRWVAVVDALLDDPDNAWWDDLSTVAVIESRDEIVAESFSDARVQLTAAMGSDPSRWEWGLLHRAAPQHPVLGGEGTPSLIRQLVNPTPQQVAGTTSAVSAMAWDSSTWGEQLPDFTVTSIPSMRAVVDLAEPDAASWVISTGASGHPASPHYTDQIGAWARGESFDWVFDLDAVRASAASLLTLAPL